MDREKFLASIYLIIKDDSGRILFQRRRGTKLWSGFLGLPAGHVDIGENVYDAAIREAKEELDITFGTKILLILLLLIEEINILVLILMYILK